MSIAINNLDNRKDSCMPLPSSRFAEIDLDRDTFTRILLGNLVLVNEEILGSDIAASYIQAIGLNVGASLENKYKKLWGWEGPLTVDLYADLIVDLKRKIHGDFFLIHKALDRVVVGSNTCPFEEIALHTPNLCKITSSIFGGIAVRNFGYAKVVLRKRIAAGDHQCEVCVYLRKNSENRLEEGDEYSLEMARASEDIQGYVQRLERDLKREKSKSQAILGAIGDGLAMIDREWRTVFANPVLRDMFGETEGEHCYEARWKRDKVCENCVAQRVFEGAEIAKELRHGFDKNNREIWVEVIATPLRENSKVVGAVEVLHDVTAVKKAEEEIRRLYALQKEEAEICTALLDVSTCLTNLRHTDELLQRVVAIAVQLTGASSCLAFLWDKRTETLTLAQRHGLEDPDKLSFEDLSFSSDLPLVKMLLREKRPVAIEDTAHSDLLPQNYADLLGTKSELIVPLVTKGEVMGTIHLQYRNKPHHFVSKEILLVQGIANQAAIAIQDAQLLSRSALIQEMHHRVKNNLQTIAHLLSLQAGRSTSAEAAEALQESINRIESIAVVHNLLSQEAFELTDIREMAVQITQTVGDRTYGSHNIKWEVRGPKVFLSSRQATAVALVINELFYNALKHAFPNTKKGHIGVELSQTDKEIMLWVSDDGQGLPPGFDPTVHGQLGLRIVETLVREELRGTFQMESKGGTRATVRFPR